MATDSLGLGISRSKLLTVFPFFDLSTKPLLKILT